MYIHSYAICVCLFAAADGRTWCYKHPTDDRDNSPLFEDHGVREQAVQDCECNDTDLPQLN